jgi:hypothetical protein
LVKWQNSTSYSTRQNKIKNQKQIRNKNSVTVSENQNQEIVTEQKENFWVFGKLFDGSV